MSKKKAVRKTPENLVLDKQALLDKYGDEQVGVIRATPDILKHLPSSGFKHASTIPPVVTEIPIGTCKGAGCIAVHSTLYKTISGSLENMLRAKAEISPDYLQPIPYVMVFSKDRERIFMTRRKNGGDARLEGMCSIGAGGHIDPDESIVKAAYRELKEELGIDNAILESMSLFGYLHSRETEVNKVHLGVVYRAVIEEKFEDKVHVAKAEQDKLEGQWVPFRDVLSGKYQGKLETWSAELVSWFNQSPEYIRLVDPWYRKSK